MDKENEVMLPFIRTQGGNFNYVDGAEKGGSHTIRENPVLGAMILCESLCCAVSRRFNIESKSRNKVSVDVESELSHECK